MKYQYILNGEILFQTDNTHEFFIYLLSNKDLMYSTLYNLLDKSNGYVCNMATANKES